jgi:hypothetical protein
MRAKVCCHKRLVPTDLCEQARLLVGAEVMLVGRHRHFEIWNRENFGIAQGDRQSGESLTALPVGRLKPCQKTSPPIRRETVEWF